MRAAVVFFGDSKRDKLLQISKALAAGIEANGHQVDIIDGTRDVSSKLTVYQYIAVGAEPVSTFGGKIPNKIGQFLKSSGMVAGKRSFAFVIKKSFSPAKALSTLMKEMEKEGMFLKYSEILDTPEEATEIGKRLRLKREH